jgi:hypothetical protein
MTITDPLWQAFAVGWFGCLFSAFPLAMLAMIPHDGWGKHLPSNRYSKMDKRIKELEQKLFESELEAKLLHELLQEKR